MKKIICAILAPMCIGAQSGELQRMKEVNTIRYVENKGQVNDQSGNPRPDVLYSANDGQITYHLKSSGISYQLTRSVGLTATTVPAASRRALLKTGTYGSSEINIYRVDLDW